MERIEAWLLHLSRPADQPVWSLKGHISISAHHVELKQDLSRMTYAEGVLNLLERFWVKVGLAKDCKSKTYIEINMC